MKAMAWRGFGWATLLMGVAAFAASARAEGLPLSRVVEGVAGVGVDGTATCVVALTRGESGPVSWPKATDVERGERDALRACVLGTAEELGTLYMEPAAGKCRADETAAVIVVSSEDDDWTDAMRWVGAKPTGACAVVLTHETGTEEPGLYESIGIDGARVYLLDEDDLIATIGEPSDDRGFFEAVGIDGARVYILDEDDRIE